jgi:hypothetical protein
MNWKDERLQNAQIFSRIGGNCIIRTNAPVIVQGLNIVSKPSQTGYVLSFKTETGKAIF